MMARSGRWLLLVAAIAAVFAIEAVWLAPVGLVDARLARMTGGTVRLERAEGTLWNARATLVAGRAGIPVAWRIEAWPLLRGEVRLQLAPIAGSPTGAPRAVVAIAGERVSLRDADVAVPAAFLVAATRPHSPWVAGGEVRMNAATLVWAPPSNRGAARILWRGARLVVPPGDATIDLGDVTIALAADGERLSGPVTNDGGELSVRGDVTLRANDALQVALALAPRSADNARLAPLLAAIGTADGAGWRVDWRLPLR